MRTYIIVILTFQAFGLIMSVWQIFTGTRRDEGLEVVLGIVGAIVGIIMICWGLSVLS